MALFVVGPIPLERGEYYTHVELSTYGGESDHHTGSRKQDSILLLVDNGSPGMDEKIGSAIRAIGGSTGTTRSKISEEFHDDYDET